MPESANAFSAASLDTVTEAVYAAVARRNRSTGSSAASFFVRPTRGVFAFILPLYHPKNRYPEYA